MINVHALNDMEVDVLETVLSLGLDDERILRHLPPAQRQVAREMYLPIQREAAQRFGVSGRATSPDGSN